ncbi:MAG TPA: pyruvate kinase [Planctomycetota bacterium]|jgi:pyruvate kinase|nr:pyruvate kinase [Planctomycetota bacterium]
MTRTRIVATLGPATNTSEKIRALIEAGVDVFRLNFSHGTHQMHGDLIKGIRHIAGDRPVAILQDLCGPKLRLTRPVKGKPGEIVEVDLPSSVKKGDPVLLADGIMHLEVVDAAHSRVIVGGDIPAGKGINLPSSDLDIPSLTDKDKVDLEFGVRNAVDYIALSFVRRASDLDQVKKSGIPVIAKIEKPEAVRRIEEIVRAADGVMVARGDLGVEIPIERVPVVQKRVISLANREGKMVITATQMLRSMVDSPLPTRAEATDVANAVLDGTDAVMLSEETAAGNYPIESVKVMSRILAEAEPLLVPRGDLLSPDPADAIAQTACILSERVGARAIIVPTSTGFTARKVSSYRPRIPILVLTNSELVRRRLSLVWGVTALSAPWFNETASVLERFRESIQGILPAGSTVVMTAGWPFARPGTTNLVHVTTV